MTMLTNTNAISFMERLQLKTIKHFDNNCQQIVYSANDISVSFYEKLSHEWLKDNLLDLHSFIKQMMTENILFSVEKIKLCATVNKWVQ